MTIEEIILKIIRERSIRNQNELLKIIRSLSGENIDQSNLSRKLKKLKIIKEHGKYIISGKKLNFSHKVIKAIMIAEPNLIIIKTYPGMANSIAITIDQEITDQNPKFKNILGTIAGDDTIFLAIDKNSNSTLIKQDLELFIK